MTSKRPVQLATASCHSCGKPARVTATASPYEFDVVCTCGMVSVISWAHKAPPPQWIEPPAEKGEVDVCT